MQYCTNSSAGNLHDSLNLAHFCRLSWLIINMHASIWVILLSSLCLGVTIHDARCRNSSVSLHLFPHSFIFQLYFYYQRRICHCKFSILLDTYYVGMIKIIPIIRASFFYDTILLHQIKCKNISWFQIRDVSKVRRNEFWFM